MIHSYIQQQVLALHSNRTSGRSSNRIIKYSSLGQEVFLDGFQIQALCLRQDDIDEGQAEAYQTRELK